MNGLDEVRVDKWLWAVRLFHTRSQAIEACRAGHVKWSGESVKPARGVRVGEVLEVRVGPVRRTVRVLQLLERRVGAPRVPEFIEDLTAPEEYARASEARRVSEQLRPKGRGRPTKRERRALEQFLGAEEGG
jgi:ribosome-associated heat shock protein Hsp15